MVRRRGPRLTLAKKTELWRRWRQGESLNDPLAARWAGSLMSCGMKSPGQAASPRRCATAPALCSRSLSERSSPVAWLAVRRCDRSAASCSAPPRP